MISLWWEILKNAKLSGKAKGKSFDASKIKINIDKDDCCEKFWLKIQRFLNDNSIVIDSLTKLRYNPDYDFKGIGHRVFEYEANGPILSSEKPCEDSAHIYLQLIKYAREIGSIPDTGSLQEMILPFELKHYENSEYPDKDIKEWEQLKDSFFNEKKKLNSVIRKCPDLVAAIREKGEPFY